jgi:hypothetical protein
MHPDATRLFALDAALRAEADGLLAASGLGAILHQAGYLPVGSYTTRTMVWRDLDFERMEEPSWARHWEVGSRFSATGWCVRLQCMDVYREASNDYGLYWGLRVAPPERTEPARPGDPTVWKLDVWTGREEEFAPSLAQRAVWNAALTEEARSHVLGLKEVLCQDPRYRRTLLSIHIYEAVLEHGVRGLETFREWWEGKYGE